MQSLEDAQTGYVIILTKPQHELANERKNDLYPRLETVTCASCLLIVLSIAVFQKSGVADEWEIPFHAIISRCLNCKKKVHSKYCSLFTLGEMTPSCFLDFMMYICVDDHDARLARQLDREIDEELKRDWSSQQMVVGKIFQR